MQTIAEKHSVSPELEIAEANTVFLTGKELCLVPLNRRKCKEKAKITICHHTTGGMLALTHPRKVIRKMSAVFSNKSYMQTFQGHPMVRFDGISVR